VGFVPLSLAAGAFDLGLGGIWAGLAAFIAIRTALGWARWRGRRWLVGGVAMVDEAA
jgi:Na+-driven multidrug efflux pump